jgi:hypothetical protein
MTDKEVLEINKAAYWRLADNDLLVGDASGQRSHLQPTSGPG